MRVLVVDETAARAEALRAALLPAGYQVTALSSPLTLLKTIEKLEPDVIIIDTDLPSRDVLEQLMMMSRHTPRPVVMFAPQERIQPILNAAIARFEEMQSLRAQLAEANQKLSDRKLVERAKGLLMKSRGLDEEAAHGLLRKMAMDRKLKLSDLAQRLVDAADLLGA